MYPLRRNEWRMSVKSWPPRKCSLCRLSRSSKRCHCRRSPFCLVSHVFGLIWTCFLGVTCHELVYLQAPGVTVSFTATPAPAPGTPGTPPVTTVSLYKSAAFERAPLLCVV